METKVVYSLKEDTNQAVDDIKKQLDGFENRMVIFFASSAYDHALLSERFSEAFPKATVFGCSTAGEIISGQMLKKSIVAMSVTSEIVEDVKVEVFENITENVDVMPALQSIEKYYNQKIDTLNYDKYVGIILIDGLSGAEEILMDKLGDKTNITIIGGSAGDDLKFEKTYVNAHGKSYSNAAILALLKIKTGFDIIKTQSFNPLDKKLLVTKAIESERQVVEFNNKPAVEAYAEALNESVENVDKCFMRNPVGLMVHNEPYVRSPQQQVNGGGIKFYCKINEGMELNVLESTDIVKDTMETIEEKKHELGDIAGIINFHCILRTLELENKGQTSAYGKIFTEIPTVGFSTYGEEYIGHVNQTSTMLVFR